MRTVFIPLLAMLGCASKIDRITIDKVLMTGMAEPDIVKGCGLGEAMGFPLNSFTKKSPNKAMVVAETTAALCAEIKAFELDRQAEMENNTIPFDHPNRIAIITDTRIQAERSHALAAQRFYNAYTYLEAEYGVLGEECPVIKEKDQSVYIIGLVAGTLSVLHDKTSGNRVGIPMDTLNRIARATACVPDEDWWYAPMAIQGAIWATIPGSGPMDTDPWEQMELAAEKGSPSGVRVAWAMHNLIAENAGQTARLKNGVLGHAESLKSHEQNKEWAFLDAYGYFISQQQLDLLWLRERGHRSPAFGEIPTAVESLEPSEEDPFGADPFGIEETPAEDNP